jgi:hypothetical protein
MGSILQYAKENVETIEIETELGDVKNKRGTHVDASPNDIERKYAHAVLKDDLIVLFVSPQWEFDLLEKKESCGQEEELDRNACENMDDKYIQCQRIRKKRPYMACDYQHRCDEFHEIDSVEIAFFSHRRSILTEIVPYSPDEW